jgi:hypothetical protein
MVTFSATGVEPVALTVSQLGGAVQTTVTFNISSHDSEDYSYASVTNMSNAYTNSTSSNYAQISLTTGSRAETWVYFLFDTSSVPSGAHIDSVSCDVKASVSTANSNTINTRTVQLFSGTTSKGNTATIASSASINTLSGTDWTREELSNLRVKVYVKRGTSQASSGQFVRVYGATLTVTYTI